MTPKFMKTKLSLLFLLLALPLGAADYTPAKPPLRPDLKLTPGDVLTNVTAAQVTTKGYATGVRNVPESVKNQVFIAYFGSVPANRDDFEVDHLVSLELGGSNDPKNLWPEIRRTPYGSTNAVHTNLVWTAELKDRLEDWMAADLRKTVFLHGDEIANGRLHLYQQKIATDWVAAYREYVPGRPPPAEPVH